MSVAQHIYNSRSLWLGAWCPHKHLPTSQLSNQGPKQMLHFTRRAGWLQGPHSPLLTPSPLAAKFCHRQKNLHFPWDSSARNTSCSACLGLQPTRPCYCVPVFPNTLKWSCVCANHTRSHTYTVPLKTERWRLGVFLETPRIQLSLSN